MAAISQNKYMELHLALMATSGDLDIDRIMRIADDAGLDTDRLAKDMEDPGIQAAIDRNHELARTIGIEGTPAFIIGSQMVPGAVWQGAAARSGRTGTDRLRQLLICPLLR